MVPSRTEPSAQTQWEVLLPCTGEAEQRGEMTGSGVGELGEEALGLPEPGLLLSHTAPVSSSQRLWHSAPGKARGAHRSPGQGRGRRGEG